MIFVRSLIFNAAFYLAIIVEMIVFTPFYFLTPRKKAWWVPRFWARTNLWLLRVICGTRVEFEGLENIPEGSYIVAAKHQSFLDTFGFLPHLDQPLFILKRQLMWIPLFGWYLAKMKMVAIERGSRKHARKKVIEQARMRLPEGRQIMIYPEGTRRAPGAPPDYKKGIVHLYRELGLSVLPIAHVAGLYWPRREFLRYPGTIRVQFLPAIEPGLSDEAFYNRLVDETETACDALLIDAAQRDAPPLPESAKRRLAELGVQPC